MSEDLKIYIQLKEGDITYTSTREAWESTVKQLNEKFDARFFFLDKSKMVIQLSEIVYFKVLEDGE